MSRVKEAATTGTITPSGGNRGDKKEKKSIGSISRGKSQRERLTPRPIHSHRYGKGSAGTKAEGPPLRVSSHPLRGRA